MSQPYDPDTDQKPWKEIAKQRLRRKLPSLPTSFEDRLLMIGVALIIIDGAHLAISLVREFSGILLWPIDFLQWILSAISRLS